MSLSSLFRFCIAFFFFELFVRLASFSGRFSVPLPLIYMRHAEEQPPPKPCRHFNNIPRRAMHEFRIVFMNIQCVIQHQKRRRSWSQKLWWNRRRECSRGGEECGRGWWWWTNIFLLRIKSIELFRFRAGTEIETLLNSKRQMVGRFCVHLNIEWKGIS